MGLKSVLKTNFIGQYLISEYHVLLSKIKPALISDEKAVKKYYKSRSGKDLDLSNPQTFSQKQQWYKLNAKNPLMQKVADKYAVRE